MTYAHLIDQTTISTNPPRSAVIGGAQVKGELPEPYLNSQGWYRLDTTPAPEPEDGYHAEPRYAYDDAETPTRIVQSWEVVQDPPPPPRVFSKLCLVAALMDAGYWTQVKAFIEAQGLMDLYLAAQTFREDDAHFAPALAALRQMLGVTDEEVEKILSAAQID